MKLKNLKEGEFKIKNKSVSRIHAEMTIGLMEGNNASKVKFKDISRFGSVVNKSKLVNKEVDLEDGAEIQFGVDPFLYKLKYNKFVFCTSSITEKPLIEKIKKLVSRYGVYSSKINHSTHLIMKDLSITHKSLLALILGIKIISMQWLEELEKRENYFQLPSYDQYMPPINEDLKEYNFQFDPRRETLFQNITFMIFDPKQLQNIGPIIVAGKGSLETSFEEDPNFFSNKFVENNYCFIQSQTNNNIISKKIKLLAQNGIELSSEEDIGRSIMLCDLKYCKIGKKNPKNKEQQLEAQKKQPNNNKSHPPPLSNKSPEKQSKSVNNPKTPSKQSVDKFIDSKRGSEKVVDVIIDDDDQIEIVNSTSPRKNSKKRINSDGLADDVQLVNEKQNKNIQEEKKRETPQKIQVEEKKKSPQKNQVESPQKKKNSDQDLVVLTENEKHRVKRAEQDEGSEKQTKNKKIRVDTKKHDNQSKTSTSQFDQIGKESDDRYTPRNLNISSQFNDENLANSFSTNEKRKTDPSLFSSSLVNFKRFKKSNIIKAENFIPITHMVKYDSEKANGNLTKKMWLQDAQKDLQEEESNTMRTDQLFSQDFSKMKKRTKK